MLPPVLPPCLDAVLPSFSPSLMPFDLALEDPYMALVLLQGSCCLVGLCPCRCCLSGGGVGGGGVI